MNANDALKAGLVKVGDWIHAGDDCPHKVGARVLLTADYRATVIMYEGEYYFKITHRPFYDAHRQASLMRYLRAQGIYKPKWRIRAIAWMIIGVLLGTGITVWELLRWHK
jgi:hypothetical protein